jgi:SAM-dependent methyltransferase
MPLLYDELAGWFHLLTAPEEYEEEAASYRDEILAAAPAARTLLELGAGGGNNAFHLKRRFACTLTDLSAPMLEISRRIDPECEHVRGDMRTLRLGRTFDAVLVHDAVMYLESEGDLRRAMATARAHLAPGGVALFVPDCVRETFRPRTSHGGRDGEDGRSLRYLEWSWDPDPRDTTFVTDFAYLLREGGEVRAVHDRHVEGLFPRATWLAALEREGFRIAASRAGDGEDEGELFVAVARPDA